MKIFITRAIPEAGLDLLRASGHDLSLIHI